MARTNYNDWNFMGDSLEASKNTKKKPLSLNGLSFLFLSSFVALILFGAVSVYSSAIGNTETIFYSQLIYLSAGIIVFVCACLIPMKVLKKLSPLLILTTLGLNIYLIVTNPLFVQSESSVLVIFIVTIMYFSSFFSNRENSVEGIRDLIAPIVVGVIFTAILSVTSDYIFVSLYILLLVAILGMYTLSFASSLMLFMFVMIPAICIVFSDASHIEDFLNYIVPGLSEDKLDAQIQLRRQCISSGSIIGKGLAMGCFKTSGISDISSSNILCNICEETGLVGAGLMYLAYILFCLSSFLISSEVKDKNLFNSNVVNAFALVIMFKIIINTATVLGYFPGNTITLPFVSYGVQIVPEMFICGCIYRTCIRETTNPKTVPVRIEETSGEIE